MELPTHPESDDTTPYRSRPTTGSRATIVVFGVIGVMIALMVLLHLTGVVGPGAR